MSSVRVWISGRVQGVGFRAWTQHMAVDRGLAGWVRNLTDGRVQAHFQGEASAVRAAVEACRSGPMSARVDDVRAEPWTDEDLIGFAFRETGSDSLA